MPEYLIALLISTAAGVAGLTIRKLDQLDTRIDVLTVKIAEEYVQKDDMVPQFIRLWDTLHRMEEKLDAHVSENKIQIQRIKDKYNLNKGDYR
jgi:hypothetical protein